MPAPASSAIANDGAGMTWMVAEPLVKLTGAMPFVLEEVWNSVNHVLSVDNETSLVVKSDVVHSV